MEREIEKKMKAAPPVSGRHRGNVHIHPQFKILRVISEDYCGTLYLAQNISTDMPVALKQFHRDVVPSLDTSLTSELSEVNIIGANAVLPAEDGTLFSVYDPPDGVTLHKIIHKSKNRPIASAVNVALTTAIIMRALHVHGKTHGHINPCNLFLKKNTTGRINIRLLYSALGGPPANFNFVNYLSPEQISQPDMLRTSDDHWAVMILLYHLLFHEEPFCAPTKEKIIENILTAPLEIPESFSAAQPRLTALLKKGLAKDFTERFANGREMILELKAVLGELRNAGESADSPISDDPDERLEAVSPLGEEDLLNDREQRDTPAANISIVPNDAKRTQPEMVVADFIDIFDERPTRQTVPTLPAPPVQSAIVVSSIAPVDSTLRSFSTIQIARRERQFMKRQRVLHIVLAAGLLCGLLVAAAVLLLSKSNAQGSPNEQIGAAVPGNESAVTSRVTGVDTPPDTSHTNEIDTGTPGIAPKNVTVHFENVPSGADFLVNGMSTEHPISLPYGSSPVAIVVNLKGVEIFATTLIPNRDISYVLPKPPVAKSTNKRVRRNAQRKGQSPSPADASATSNSKGRLSSNPYQLRKNPFSVGEQK